MKRAIAALLLVMLAAVPAQAVNPDEILDDPVLEARARALSKQLRCVVCQNQSIDDSDAPLARDLRLLVRERLVAGDTDAATVAFVVARYGDFVLLQPPFKPKTYGLWFGPWLALAAAGLIAFWWYRARPSNVGEVPPLTDSERERLDALVDELDNPDEGAMTQRKTAVEMIPKSRQS